MDNITKIRIKMTDSQISSYRNDIEKIKITISCAEGKLFLLTNSCHACMRDRSSLAREDLDKARELLRKTMRMKEILEDELIELMGCVELKSA